MNLFCIKCGDIENDLTMLNGFLVCRKCASTLLASISVSKKDDSIKHIIIGKIIVDNLSKKEDD